MGLSPAELEAEQVELLPACEVMCHPTSGGSRSSKFLSGNTLNVAILNLGQTNQQGARGIGTIHWPPLT